MEVADNGILFLDEISSMPLDIQAKLLRALEEQSFRRMGGNDLVKVDGRRIALGEVEGCIESFPKVKAAQALVIDDPLGGPMVVARVIPTGRFDAEEVIDHCARNLAPYKVPRRIEFCEDLAG